MNPESSKTMITAALGRPFSLGMLYDCRQDLLIPGMTLWDSDALEENLGERMQSYNDFEIVSSESMADKSSALNVEASLKASVLSGLVDVEGSAKYLHDDKTSKNQARVTLKYEATTKFQELSMEHLGNMKYPHVFEQGIATHVVTGVLYGAKAFFVFDRDVSDDENHQDIEGYLKVMINKIPSVGIGGSGSVKLEETDKEKVEKFSCRFHGDFLLEKTPSTFEGAIEVYQSLSKLLGENGENAVPMKVWLFPLTNLNSKAAKLVRQISEEFVDDAQAVLEDLKEVDIGCSDALKASTTEQFPEIGKKLKRFKEMSGEFKVEFQRNLAKMLPSIRGGGAEEAALAEILEKRVSSPFNNTSLNEWLDCKEREMYTVMSVTGLMKNIRKVTSQIDLYKEVLSVEHAVCFVFTSLGEDEPYLSALSNYLKGTQPGDPQDPQSPDVEKEQWYASKEVMDAMRTKAKLFSDFAEANKENKNTKFLTAGLTDETHKGSTIYLYKDGFTVSENFEPPSKPESVTAALISPNSVILKISPPRYGAENITSYSAEFCISGEDEWKQKEGKEAGGFTVSGLTSDTEYVFRCRAVTPLGVGPASEITIRTPRMKDTVKKKPADVLANETLSLRGHSSPSHSFTSVPFQSDLHQSSELAQKNPP
ncbi:stonustoxin subunit alpha-like [Odontesthes bonariensis]|uniref:stonustoxin subunit alpha-like n=1 Tax=Odontesthes bonariensis TaxID=219752 RepID=UPI003F58A315